MSRTRRRLRSHRYSLGCVQHFVLTVDAAQDRIEMATVRNEEHKTCKQTSSYYSPKHQSAASCAPRHGSFCLSLNPSASMTAQCPRQCSGTQSHGVTYASVPVDMRNASRAGDPLNERREASPRPHAASRQCQQHTLAGLTQFDRSMASNLSTLFFDL
ncbi:hypothetical protein L226DRAFT_352575 [Lentinus tigrinus ALCF2SS1-7]|uniref:uncharacterized protein n=1 Tax=Lentinus tigrinus ALCF2SS1-7 TaxID=1328758 RepID=UPI0011660670|nr:hypothetical protein L226DRAFT_352575 [Lentinus tigrinus ALCF2SS1-7]